MKKLFVIVKQLFVVFLIASCATAQTASTTYTVTHMYVQPGTYIVTGGATDAIGFFNTGSAIESITGVIATTLPNVLLTLSPTPATPGGSIGNPPIAVTATVTSNATCTTTIAVNWGDGTQTVGSPTTHTYQVGGPYTVIGSVTDCFGNTGIALSTFVVGPLSPINGIQIIVPTVQTNVASDVYTPVRIYAVITSASAVTSATITVDGNLVYTTPQANSAAGYPYVLDKYLPETVGTTHIITVQGFMQDGTSVTETVQVKVLGVIN